MTLTADVFGARSQLVAEIGERKRESQATAIVRLALEAGVELWHTPTGDAYITIAVGGHHEHHPLASHATRDYVLCRHWHGTPCERTAGCTRNPLGHGPLRWRCA